MRVIASTWESRDLPVLEAVVEEFEAGCSRIFPHAVARRTGMSRAQVDIALDALLGEEPPYFRFDPEYPAPHVENIVSVTGHARRTVGSWPTPEQAAGRLVAGLEQAAEREPDEENRSRLRKTAAWFGGAGRDVAIDLAASVLNRQITGG